MKTKEEIEQLAEKEYREYPNNPINKEDWYYNKDNNCHRKRKAFVKGYTQCQDDMAHDLKVTRFEVVDENGRVYTKHDCKIELSYQDDGKTLKVFIKPLNKQD
jgi:hypothetical protein